MQRPDQRSAVVFFHAHPDDEALLTAGSMARLSAAGRRVVLVLATVGESGLSASALRDDGRLGERRLAEAHASAAVLGVQRVEILGYRDSGIAIDPTRRNLADAPPRFVDADLDESAGRLADILISENAAVLTSYDSNGGYGHPDHRRVHEVATRAAAWAGTPRLLEATAPREPILAALQLADRLLPLPADFSVADWAGAYTPMADITHRIDVQPWLRHRRASMRAHASQSGADSGLRTLGVAGHLPAPLFGRLFGYEWYRDPRLARGGRRRTTFFDPS